jgi:hypothetical protein
VYGWETTNDGVVEEERFPRYTNAPYNDHMRADGDVADHILPRREQPDQIVMDHNGDVVMTDGDQARDDEDRESFETARQAPGILTVLNRQVTRERS